MTNIEISDNIYSRLIEFKRVIETVIEEELSIDACVNLILSKGMDSMLVDLIGSLDPSTLLLSFQQLASQYPAQVYRYITETLKQGSTVNQKENWKKRIGF